MATNSLLALKNKALAEIEEATIYAARFKRPKESFENWFSQHVDTFQNCEDVNEKMRLYVFYSTIGW